MTIERQLRCVACGMRLMDYEDGIKDGLAVIEVKCRKCGETNRLTLGRKTP